MKPLGPLRSKRIKKIVAAMRGARANELDDSAPERFIGMGRMKTMEVGVEREVSRYRFEMGPWIVDRRSSIIDREPVWGGTDRARPQKSQRPNRVSILKLILPNRDWGLDIVK